MHINAKMSERYTPVRNSESRIVLFAGHYGSGKSEIAVNYALNLARQHRTAIVDFDIINPYFRTASARMTLEQNGVRVVAPIFANTNVEIPALPAEISTIFDDKSLKAVFDVGGDSAGAKAVSRYRDEFIAEKLENFFVFNIRRPTTSNVDAIINIFFEIQAAARLPFTSLVNNTNLLSYTTEADLLDGLDAALELSGRLSLPVAFNALMDAVPEQSHPSDTDPHRGGLQEFYARSAKLGIPVFHLSKYISMEY